MLEDQQSELWNTYRETLHRHRRRIQGESDDEDESNIPAVSIQHVHSERARDRANHGDDYEGDATFSRSSRTESPEMTRRWNEAEAWKRENKERDRKPRKMEVEAEAERRSLREEKYEEERRNLEGQARNYKRPTYDWETAHGGFEQ